MLVRQNQFIQENQKKVSNTFINMCFQIEKDEEKKQDPDYIELASINKLR